MRELKNVVERSVLINTTDQIDLKEIIDLIDKNPKQKSSTGLPDIGTITLEELEMSMIKKSARLS